MCNAILATLNQQSCICNLTSAKLNLQNYICERDWVPVESEHVFLCCGCPFFARCIGAAGTRAKVQSALLRRRVDGVACCFRLLMPQKFLSIYNWAGFCGMPWAAHPSRALERRLDRSRSGQTRGARLVRFAVRPAPHVGRLRACITLVS